MGDKTGISWTDATWNPVRGCSRVSEGCRNCYAERVAARFSGPGQPYEGLARIKTTIANNEERDPGNKRSARWTGVVRLIPEHLADPLRWKKPRRIFVNSMSDLFHEGLTNEQIAAVFGVMAAAPQHTFQVLTKRATRMREWFAWARERAFEDGESVLDYGLMLSGYVGDEMGNGSLDAAADHSERIQDLINDGWARDGADGGTVFDTPWPLPNVWLGVSVENQAAADERIPELLKTPAAVRFLSCEPLIGPVDLRAKCPPFYAPHLRADRVSWVIAGCESGPGARPCSVEWLRSMRDLCAATGVPFFLKQAAQPGSEAVGGPLVTAGDGSKRKAGGVIELPYLDGVQHASFPEVP
jgi:protein gp37